MSRRLTMDDYRHWTPEQKDAVRVWLTDHGLDADQVVEVDLGGTTASFVRIHTENGRPVPRLDGQGLARDIVTRPLKRPFIVTRPLKRPFPVEAA